MTGSWKPGVSRVHGGPRQTWRAYQWDKGQQDPGGLEGTRDLANPRSEESAPNTSGFSVTFHLSSSPQVNYHDVHLQMPVVDHPAVHCTNPAAIAPSSAAPAHGARVFNPVAAHLNNATHNCGSLDTLESRSVTLTP